MKSLLTKKLLFLVCLSLICVLTFTACKEKTVYTNKNIEKEKTTSDSDSDYWKDPPEEDIYLPNNSDDVTGETPDFSTNDNNDSTESGSSNKIDTDNDGIPNTEDDDIDNDDIKNENDTDIDGDGVKNENDTDIDGDGVKNENDNDMDSDGVENDKDDNIDNDGDKNEDDKTPEGPKNNNNESPFVAYG